MAFGDAELRVNFKELRRALQFVIKAPRASRAQVTAGFDGKDLILTRARSSARVSAVGSWPGTATISARGLLEKLDVSRVDGEDVALKVAGAQLWIGEFVVDCDWNGLKRTP